MAVDRDETFIVKLRGLPWNATVDEIMKFFETSNIKGGKNGVHMTISRGGRPSGEAFIEFEDAEDFEKACLKDREHMGNRYIEIFKANKEEMDWMIKRTGATYDTIEDGCVRLRGLPFGCSKEEIAQFFTGLEIVPNGITLMTDHTGSCSGEAYVHFITKEIAEKALLKHRERIGHRYIEIFRSSLSEVNSMLSYSNRQLYSGGGFMDFRPGRYDSGDRYVGRNRFHSRGSPSFKRNSSNSLFCNFDNRPWKMNDYMYNPYVEANTDYIPSGSGLHCIHMRGLPFKASQKDIADFFNPIIPVDIKILIDDKSRLFGEADVQFSCHEDAVYAMSKDKGFMQHRYIELFMNSEPRVKNEGGNGGPVSYGGNLGRRWF